MDVKGIVAIIVVIGSFVLIGAPVLRGQVPGTVEFGFASGALMLVLGFYFGHVNGAATALANNATALAGQAITAAAQRRGSDLAEGAVPVAAVVVAAPAPHNTGVPPA